MKILRRRNRVYDTERFGQPEIRVYHKKGDGKRMPRYLLKCGCCGERLEIYYHEDGLEIGGINGAIEDWREILLPLLEPPRAKKKRPEKTAMSGVRGRSSFPSRTPSSSFPSCTWERTSPPNCALTRLGYVREMTERLPDVQTKFLAQSRSQVQLGNEGDSQPVRPQ